MRRLVSEAFDALLSHETAEQPRKRARRAADREAHEAVLQAIVCNLAHAVLCPPLPSGRLAIKLGHNAKGVGRYDHPAFGKKVSPMLYQLEELGVLTLHFPKAIRGEVPSIAPTSGFAQRVRELRISLSDFGRADGEEVLVLTSKKGTGARASRELVDYRETVGTIAMREEVRKMNAFLADADIAFLPDGLEPQIDHFDRLLKRRFVLPHGIEDERFDMGGRLFGGFWQNLRSARRVNIRIDGEEVVDLDYSSMFSRLAYAAMGAQPPEGDLYAIPGLEDFRGGVKLAFNVFLFDSFNRRSKWPEGDNGIWLDGGAAGEEEELEEGSKSSAARLPEEWSPKRLRQAILLHHPPLREAFGRGLGYGLMFTESRVLLAVLRDLRERGIVGLPLHDGLLVPHSRKGEAGDAMRQVALEVVGFVLPAKEKA